MDGEKWEGTGMDEERWRGEVGVGGDGKDGVGSDGEGGVGRRWDG